VAIAWLLAQGTAIIPIPSARTVAHALDALRGANLALTERERLALDAVTF
jgi:aryl-alcohol dehydrogenase-like predicted oxidoreductase